MKAAGETFSSKKIEREPKEKDVLSIQTLRQKNRFRTGLWRVLDKITGMAL